MRRAEVYVHGTLAGHLEEHKKNADYRFTYIDEYTDQPVSLTMPLVEKEFRYEEFPPFFDGLLPEGVQLEGLLRQLKIDKRDYLAQLIAVGADLVGAVTVKGIE